MMPIYDDPNHPLYGPARRVHLILLYLYGSDLPRREEAFQGTEGMSWTTYLKASITEAKRSERATAEHILWLFLN